MYLVRRMLLSQWKKIGKMDAERKAKLTFPPNVTADRDIAYLADGHPMHKLNIWCPQDAQGLLPVVVDIHGGGWMYGDKDLNEFYCASLAAQGFAVVTMSYRLMPETDLMGMARDVFASLGWLETHAAEHHCDLSRVFLTGDSAGGHLTGLICCICLSERLQRLYGVRPLSFAFKAIAISHGACDMRSLDMIPGALGKLIGREMRRMLFGKNKELAQNASFRDTVRGLLLPPVLVISSEPDGLFPQSQAIAQILREMGAKYETKFWTKEQGERLNHVFNIAYPDWPESQETNARMLAFFLESLGA